MERNPLFVSTLPRCPVSAAFEACVLDPETPLWVTSRKLAVREVDQQEVYDRRRARFSVGNPVVEGDGCMKGTHHLVRHRSRHPRGDAKLLGA